MRFLSRNSVGSWRAIGPSRLVFRLAVPVLVAVALIGLTTWGLDQSTSQAAAKRAPERNWNLTLVLKIPSAAIKHPAAAAPAGGFAAGSTIGRIVIPRMSLDSPLLEMANCEDQANLNRGPCHIKGTALPGTAGNCAIAGHRNTYTEPFARMSLLKAGDEIDLVELSGARHVYTVNQIWVVSPDQVSVLDPTPQPSLTLITCHPPGSSRTRLIIRAVLSG